MEPLPILTDNPSPRGFTLAEMIVVLAIIVIITGVVLTSHSDFDRTLSITDTAYTVALSVRQAQTFGISSRTYTSVSNAAYGLHFTSADPTRYQLFADLYPAKPGVSSAYCPGHTVTDPSSPDAKPGNCIYDATQSETVQTFTFSRGFSITNMCGHDTAANGGALRCTQGGYLTGVDVVFLRPNTDSIVVGLKSSGNISLTDAQITLSAPQGGSRLICVTSVGEVSVATSSCP